MIDAIASAVGSRVNIATTLVGVFFEIAHYSISNFTSKFVGESFEVTLMVASQLFERRERMQQVHEFVCNSTIAWYGILINRLCKYQQ